MGSIVRTALVVFVCLAASSAALACDFDDIDGPDVALVLSGGGALTSTQVGVMQVMEEVGVPVHCVLGTSMGSVTGAMYVAGYSAEEIADIYRERPWGEIFRGQISRNDQAFRQKEGYDDYFADYFAGVGSDGVKLPGGLSSMGGLQATFRDIFYHIPNASDFTRDFRVPYRSVAMNLSTGEAVAFPQGDLVQTILASMAVPGVFAPRQINDELYIDGGMAAQLPVQFAKDMGADIIIAVDTTIEPARVEGSPSVTTTASQLIQITVYRNRQQDVARLGENDLLITPDLTGLSSSGFTLIDEGVASGRAEAEKHRAQLEDIARRAAPARNRAIDPFEMRENQGPLTVENLSDINDELVLNRLDLDNADPNDRETIDSRLRSLSSFGAFGDVDLSRSKDGQYLKIVPREIGKNLLQAGFRASTTFDGDARYALLARLSRRPIGSYGGEGSVSFELGTDLGVALQYDQPFGPDGRFFVSPLLRYRGEEVLFDLGDQRLGEFYEQRVDARLRIGRELGDWGVVMIEGVAAAGDIDTVVTSVPDLLPGRSYEIGGGAAYFGVDTLNRTTWPTSGFSVLTSAELMHDFDTEEESQKYNIYIATAHEIGSVGLNLRLQAEGIEDDGDVPIQILNLGGFRRVSAFAENSIPTDQYALVTADIFRRLTGSEEILNFPVYLGGTLEYAEISFDLFEERAFDLATVTQRQEDKGFAGSLYLGGDSPFGPLYLGLGASEFGDRAAFLHFGRAF
ncbi:patatin-like phospholipase family protein [Aquisalinus flavus]|uniref:Patatin n=1 Tax=Aquisalinus flavus TaxID=1526572 RepID=A0A8J2V2N0_9PROT|nr:patatin-like phospholipase family protein [Aquisalinus flavus]MBD0427625.1 patatin-like phospholipase family protein [Aquisalinus flavus]GGD02495.1 patatin [Aquisalinus flavus]